MNHAKFLEKIKKQCVQFDVPALAIAVVQHGKLVIAEGFGEGISSKTRFPLASITKSLTGTMIMRLVERGLLSLDRPVIEYVPWLRYPQGGDVKSVTLRHLLSHTSGLSSDPDPDAPGAVLRNGPDALEAHIREDIPNYAAIAPPGEVLWYSNPGLNLAGYIAEIITGTSYDQLMQEILFDPLELAATTFKPAAAQPFSWAKPRVGEAYPLKSGLYPDGGAISTIEDLAKFAILHLNEGKYNGQRLLSTEHVQEMHRPHADAFTTEPSRYGITFTIQNYKGLRLFGHGGGLGSYGTAMTLAPTEHAAIILLFNSPGGYAISPFAILDDVLNLPDTTSEPQTFEMPARWAEYAGVYENRYTLDWYDPRIELIKENGGLLLKTSKFVTPLHASGARTLTTEDESVTIGLIPPKDYAGPKFTTFNDAPIGLVSAWPYRKIT